MPEDGSCEMTIPSSEGLSVSSFSTCTAKPDSLRMPFAVWASEPPTSGIAVVVGPFETVSVIVECGATKVFPGGSWAITMPAG